MSEKTEVDQEYDDENANATSVNLPEHQYTRDELYDLSRSPASKRRPKCLETKFDSDDGWWDPERWYKAKFITSREASPLTLLEGKERRRGLPDLDVKRRPSVDSVERLKEKDGIVLSPQRRSFGTGCHVQNPPSFVRQISIPERDEAKVERERDRERDRDRIFNSIVIHNRERERPIRKIGSGRIQIDKENAFSNIRDRDRDRERERDRFDERDLRGDRERDRDRDYAWSRDRNDRDRGEREWDRDRDHRDNRDRDNRDARDHRDDWDRDRERRFDRSDRFRRPNDREFPERGERQRDREFHHRDRAYDKHSRRRNTREEEKQPEWFTGGPTSQNETIELRGFEKDPDVEDTISLRPNPQRQELRKRQTPPKQKYFKDFSEEVSEADVKASQRSSPEEDQQTQTAASSSDKENERKPKEKPEERKTTASTKGEVHAATSDKGFDIDDILNSVPLPDTLEREGQKVSRFSRFFSARGNNQTDNNTVITEIMSENMQDEDDDSHGLSPTAMAGFAYENEHNFEPNLEQQAISHHLYQQHHHAFLEHQHILRQRLEQGDGARQMELMADQQQVQGHLSSMKVPTSAGDNARSSSVTSGGKSGEEGGGPLSASVTALFKSAAASTSGTNARKWMKPSRLDSSVGPLDSSSIFTDSAISSGSSFSAQDASAQLKAMLFGGPSKESAPSSGTASPASLPPGVQHKIKTLAELEADLHQSSLPSTSATTSSTNDCRKDSGVGQEGGSGDMTAFKKLLFMMNATPEGGQTSMEPQSVKGGYSLLPGHNQFMNAVQKNKEEQKLLQQQSLQNVMGPPPPPMSSIHLGQPPPPSQTISVASLQQIQIQQSGFQAPGMQMHNQVPQRIGKPFSLTPQAMSTPAAMSQNARPQSSSADPIFSLIQQNPSIVMKPASPSMSVASLIASQHQQAKLSGGARGMSPSEKTASPIMFSQQPPQHLNAPSPIRTGHLSPTSPRVAGSIPLNHHRGPPSPVLQGELHQQELQNALIKQHLLEQNGQYIKHPQDGTKSPTQLQMKIVKPAPAAQHVLPPNPQPKGASVNTFTPTSVLRKMHNDKALVKERQAQEGKSEEDLEFMPSMREMGGSQGSNELLGLHQRPASADNILSSNSNNLGSTSATNVGGSGSNLNLHHHHHEQQHDLSEISFLDPVNPDLVAMTSHLESQLRIGSGNLGGPALVLPGTLSHPMSVEEKVGPNSQMKLSALAEKPGYLSQMLDISKAAAEARLRPIVKATSDVNFEDRIMQPPQLQNQMLQQHTSGGHGGRPVTGSGINLQQKHSYPSGPQLHPSTLQQAPPQSQPLASGKSGSGRAIVGGSSSVQQQQQNVDMMRMYEQQQMQHYMQGMVLPPPPMGPPMAFPGPPPMGIPIAVPTGAPRLPGIVPGQMLASQQGRMAMLQHQQQQQQMARANALNTQQRQQQHHQMLMAMQQQQHRMNQQLQTTVPNQHAHSQAGMGPLSPSALSAAIQRVASPQTHHVLNGPMSGGSQHQPHPSMAAKVDVGSGIQRWFSPDILKTQLPSMPPLPTQGNKVMTVDELERA